MFPQYLAGPSSPNSEQRDLHFVKHTLTQWIKRWEQRLNLKLFGPRKRDRFVEFNVDGLLRGDFRTRMEGYAKAIQNAINTPDEVREREGWPSQGGDAGKLHIQGATVPLGEQLQRGCRNHLRRATAMTIEREIRFFGGLAVEQRKTSEPPTLRGYAAVFNTETNIGGYWREQVARGAFADAISKASADVHALFNHDPSQVLGG